MGSTGHSTGTHLHYEIHKYGIAINPLIYVDLPYTEEALKQYSYSEEQNED